MIPGLNKKKLEQAMKQMGVKQEAIEAKKVIIETPDKNLIIDNPDVLKVNMMGQESLQITGQIREEDIEEFSAEDVKTVTDQTGCSEEDARKALEEIKVKIKVKIDELKKKKESEE